MKSSVVIGANWGDEGKGLVTDYLCRLHKADLVVRFNGGAQAGHTVVTPEGRRHVFNHIGSGYFTGVPTYLSEYFILNPIIFRREFEELGVPEDYAIYASWNCRVTTYWDMLANRCLEQLRGGKAHGSCGCGINETIERDRYFIGLLYKDWFSETFRDTSVILEAIAEFWHESLIEAGKIYHAANLPEWAADAFSRKGEINKKFREDIRFMFDRLSQSSIYTMRWWDSFEYAVFEGAQGLGLDQFYGNYPYVTRSNTGIRNVLEMQRNGNVMGGENFEIDEIVYVSRTYETRHGNDPFFTETDSQKLLERAKDLTNVPNEWQGTLRCSKLNYYNMGNRIGLDIQANNLRPYAESGKIKLAMTHCDQNQISNGDIFYRVGGNTRGAINEASYKSFGETCKDVSRITDCGKIEKLS
jgi:adenylosuccinate synthase